MQGTVLCWSPRLPVPPQPRPAPMPLCRGGLRGSEGQSQGPKSHSLEGQARPRVGDLSGRGHPLAAPCFCLTSATNSLWDSGQVTAPL